MCGAGMRTRSIWKYFLCVLMAVGLVTASFWLPELAMEAIDKQTESDYVFQSRSGIDYNAVSLEYEMELAKRLQSFAKGNESGNLYYVISADSGDGFTSEEQERIYKGILDSDYYWHMLAIYDRFNSGELKNLGLNGMWMLDLERLSSYSYDVLDSRYYVIYNGDVAGGETFLCWYLDLGSGDTMRLRLLVDAKDFSVYCMESYNSDTELIRWIMDNRSYGRTYGRTLLEEYFFGNYLTSMSTYYSSLNDLGDEYWEAYATSLIDHWGETDTGENYGLQKAEVMEALGLSLDSGDFSRREEEGSELSEEDFQYLDKRLSGKLQYDDGSLTFEFGYVQTEGTRYTGIFSGIREMKELLPQELWGESLDGED